ncbi:Receptor expression-enhancing protein 3 [Oryzias melastigma]|uniref:Receptor expression-enhancing protein 3 n=1 Tax=Oryzias melastigma TaxID=30732 RepID=A0A834CCH7_ORYME|nr:Receptor expression-enhancing protein 3 [Oryzias melastigma]
MPVECQTHTLALFHCLTLTQTKYRVTVKEKPKINVWQSAGDRASMIKRRDLTKRPEPTFSEDEAVSQKGLRRSQSVKMTRSRARKDARYGSLKIKGKKRPALSSVNYGMARDTPS